MRSVLFNTPLELPACSEKRHNLLHQTILQHHFECSRSVSWCSVSLRQPARLILCVTLCRPTTSENVQSMGTMGSPFDAPHPRFQQAAAHLSSLGSSSSSKKPPLSEHLRVRSLEALSLWAALEMLPFLSHMCRSKLCSRSGVSRALLSGADEHIMAQQAAEDGSAP